MRNRLVRQGKGLDEVRTFGVVMEPVERRQLKSVSVSTGSSLSDLTGDYFGEIIVGGNGVTDATPTAATGAFEQEAWSYGTWDANLDDGLDSGWVKTTFAAGDGGVNWAVANAGPASFSTGSVAVHEVTIRAAVLAPEMAIEWKDLVVQFYNGGQLVESVSVGSLTASSMNATSYDPVEAIAVVSGSSSSYDGVVITGYARLQAAEGAYPGAYDIFGQVLIS